MSDTQSIFLFTERDQRCYIPLCYLLQGNPQGKEEYKFSRISGETLSFSENSLTRKGTNTNNCPNKLCTKQRLTAPSSHGDGRGPGNFCYIGNFYVSDAFASRIKLFPLGLYFFTIGFVSIPGDACNRGISRKKNYSFLCCN